MKYNIKAIGTNIRNARLKRNYSQDYLALKLNLTQNGYSKIELGYSPITVERLMTIAEVLEVNEIDLMNPDNAMQIVKD